MKFVLLICWIYSIAGAAFFTKELLIDQYDKELDAGIKSSRAEFVATVEEANRRRINCENILGGIE